MNLALGFAISAYHIDKDGRKDLRPSELTAKKIVFFRLGPGSKYKPAVGDDIVISKMGIEDFKAFGDPKEEDALLWARWGGSSFEQNQSRQYTVNPYDDEYEATLKSASTLREGITLKDFIRIIEVNFPERSSAADIEGYLNRYHMVLLTDKWIYHRLATDSTADDAIVPRMPWPNPAKPDLFRPEATAVLRAFKKDQSFLPDGFAQSFDWDVALLQMLAKGQKPARTTTLVTPSLFGGPVRTICTHPLLVREKRDTVVSDAPPAVGSLSESSRAGEVKVNPSAFEDDYDADPMGFNDMVGPSASDCARAGHVRVNPDALAGDAMGEPSEANDIAAPPAESPSADAAGSRLTRARQVLLKINKEHAERTVQHMTPEVNDATAPPEEMPPADVGQARESVLTVKQEGETKLPGSIKQEWMFEDKLKPSTSSRQCIDLDSDSPGPPAAKVAKLEPEALEAMRAVQAAFSATVEELSLSLKHAPAIQIDDDE